MLAPRFVTSGKPPRRLSGIKGGTCTHHAAAPSRALMPPGRRRTITGTCEGMENPCGPPTRSWVPRWRVWFLRLIVTCAAAPSARLAVGRTAGPRPSTARQGRAQCRGSGRTAQSATTESDVPPAGGTSDSVVADWAVRPEPRHCARPWRAVLGRGPAVRPTASRAEGAAAHVTISRRNHTRHLGTQLRVGGPQGFSIPSQVPVIVLRRPGGIRALDGAAA